MEAGVENANSIECIFKNNAQISRNADEELRNIKGYRGLQCNERSDTIKCHS